MILLETDLQVAIKLLSSGCYVAGAKGLIVVGAAMQRSTKSRLEGGDGTYIERR